MKKFFIFLIAILIALAPIPSFAGSYGPVTLQNAAVAQMG